MFDDWSYVILSKIAHIADDPNPDKHGACPEEDAAHVITCEDLKQNSRGFKKMGLKSLQFRFLFY